MTEGKKKRGRPPGPPVRIEYVRPVTREDLEWYEATRDRGGPRPKRALNQALLEVKKDADRRGISLRDGLREFAIKCKPGLSPEEVEEQMLLYERRINRRRPSASKSRPTLKNELRPETEFKNKL
jgi:hypothetical protein